MGEAVANKKRRAQEVVFDFAAPAVNILKADRWALCRDGDNKQRLDGEGRPDTAFTHARATCSTIVNLVEVAYPQRMRPKDGEDYEVWLEAMSTIDQEEDPEDPNTLPRFQVEVTVGDVEWILQHLKNDNLGVPTGMVQWRRAVRQYAEALIAEKPIPAEAKQE